MRTALYSILSAGALALGLLAAPAGAQAATAIFAGGCFWSVEKMFDGVPGVTETVSGFAGGRTENPTYYEVVRGGTGHHESVKVTYDPARVSYEDLLTAYWQSIDPTDPAGQFCDKGEPYRAAIFVSNEAERQAAEASKAKVAEILGAGVTTQILPAAPFTAAGPEHQNFHVTNPAHYERYRIGCRRDETLARVWGGRSLADARSG